MEPGDFSERTIIEHISDRQKENEQQTQKQSELLESARRTASEEANEIKAEKSNSDNQKQNEKLQITKLDKMYSYKLTMSKVQSSLPNSGRRFSKLIHNPVMEKASESLEKTIARPSGILGGGLLATIGLLAMVIFAKRNGFELSGSELIVLLVVGWFLGLMIELIWKYLINRR